VTCYTHPCNPYKVICLLHYLPLGDESSPRGRWSICAPALPELLTHTSDISPLAEYTRYKWVKFWDTGQSFLDSKEWIGRDLGPTIDIGYAMAHKVLKINGKIMFRVSVRGLTLDEIQSPDEQKRHQ
jgi:hypothetical protein